MPKPGDKVAAPRQNDSVSQDQIDSAINASQFPGATADKAWHQGPDGGGLFESWTTGYGYKEGFALYGGVLVDKQAVHIYYLANTSQTILLKTGQTPSDYSS
jgi:hypothetical protein